MKTLYAFRRIVLVILVLVFLCAAACAEGVPEAGSLVTFGHYEQDGNTENGPEAIQWTVLDTDGDRVFLLSKYGLDAKQYNVKYTRVTWETCSLRQWLNSTFLNSAFSAKEKQRIILTNNVNNDSPAGVDRREDLILQQDIQTHLNGSERCEQIDSHQVRKGKPAVGGAQKRQTALIEHGNIFA